MPSDKEATRVEAFLRWVQNHKVISVVVILGICVIVLGKFFTSLHEIVGFFRPESAAPVRPESPVRPLSPSVFPSPSPRPAETTNPLPIASATPAESGLMEMTIQQFTRRYLELDGIFAEQETFLKHADRKRVRWKVIFVFPTSRYDRVTLQFDVPAELHNEKSLRGSPVRWADFPLNFHDRVYSLRRGDLVEISGVLNYVANTLVIRGDDFDVVTAPTLTPSPRIKKKSQ